MFQLAQLLQLVLRTLLVLQLWQPLALARLARPREAPARPSCSQGPQQPVRRPWGTLNGS